MTWNNKEEKKIKTNKQKIADDENKKCEMLRGHSKRSHFRKKLQARSYIEYEADHRKKRAARKKVTKREGRERNALDD